jgi:hypothetical protein
MRMLIFAFCLCFSSAYFGQEKDTSYIIKTSKCQLKYSFHEYKTDTNSLTTALVSFKIFSFNDYSDQAVKLKIKKEKIQVKLIYDKDCRLERCELLTKSKIPEVNEELKSLFLELIDEYNKNNFNLIWDNDCSNPILSVIYTYN